jgi:hypothetical protein
MNDQELASKLADECHKLRKEVERMQKPFCPKCGVASDFHVNMYCRKIQGLTKGISRLKQQLAEANNKLKNEYHD